MTLPRGNYDLLVDDLVAQRLRTIAPDQAAMSDLSVDEAAERLSEHFANELRRALDDVGGDNSARIGTQLGIVNELIRHLRTTYGDASALPNEPARLLRAIHSAAVPAPLSPDTGLSTPWLFTAGKGSPSLLNELLRELSSCDSIDVLVSFITVSGVRKLLDTLMRATASDAHGRGRTKIRILTTTYTGATQVAALDELARLNGCEVRVSMDGRRTRLHAKAWIFRRHSGFGSAYVGSANLSGAALMGGLEWTVKFTERGQTPLFQRALAHFDTLWADPEFRRYHPDDAASRAALLASLDRERGGSGGHTADIPVLFDIQPKHYQRVMLDDLAFERVHGRWKNLVVAATGTGKTVIAALDYRRITETEGHRPRLLFIAHREEILRQALGTYRAVLRDNSFGSLVTGDAAPADYAHAFVSIQHASSRDIIAGLGADHWYCVVIDECHHLPANSFHRFATEIKPQILLGLTATPERSDGRSLDQYFDQRPDGSPAVELRLWQALDTQLLSPFEYYACDDDTDLTGVVWDGGLAERSALDRLFTNNESRANTVINEWRRLSGDVRASRALAFCVSRAHAEYMSGAFERAGIPSLCVHGETPSEIRQSAKQKLLSGEVSVLVTVDLYNEGVDLPDADTLLLLRPTQSPVLFQQQIGRGLRLSPKKDSCLVLDFVGRHRQDFRYDALLSGLTGLTRKELIEGLEDGFNSLPAGCHIHLQQQSRQQILASLRSLTRNSWRRLQAELNALCVLRGTNSVSLSDFLHHQSVKLEEVFRDQDPAGWTSLRQDAGLLRPSASPEAIVASHGYRQFLHINDPWQISFLRRVANARGRVSPADGLRAQMLAYQFDTGRAAVPASSVLPRIVPGNESVQEILDLADVLEGRTRVPERTVPGLEDLPLCLHASYSRSEVLTAVGYHTESRRPSHREGVCRIAGRNLEVLFVTLDKSKGFHSSVAYSDYAITPERFHWQSQNATSPESPSGRRYLEGDASGWTFQLFVREKQNQPFVCCGPVRVLSPDDVTGSRPMSIEWSLAIPLPSELFRSFSVLRGDL